MFSGPRPCILYLFPCILSLCSCLLSLISYLPTLFSCFLSLFSSICIQYHSVSPLVGTWTPPPPHLFAGEGVGVSQFRRLEKKLSTLPTLCSWPVSSSLPLISCFLPPPFRFYIFFMLNLKYRSSNLGYPPIFFTYRKHRFIELAIRQIPKNLDLSKSNNRKKVVEPSTSNHEKNIGRPPLFFYILELSHECTE
jgi:hypothetical protein